MISSMRIKYADNPRYVAECDYATILEWTPLAPTSISGRARDVLRKVADGIGQLPLDRPGIIHVGFEAVEGDAVEELRHQRIVASMSEFDPGQTPLEYVYSHFLAPESPLIRAGPSMRPPTSRHPADCSSTAHPAVSRVRSRRTAAPRRPLEGLAHRGCNRPRPEFGAS
jgi:hypothetical protein